MPHMVVAVDVAAPVGPTWEAITDWPGHARFAPLTTIRVTTPSATGAGTRFVARTALGPVGFDDPMEVVEWSPPAGGSAGYCVVHKHGRLVLGTARIDVTPCPGDTSRLSWTYDIEVAPVRLTRPFASLIGFATGLGLKRVLGTVARDVERGQAAG